VNFNVYSATEVPVLSQTKFLEVPILITGRF